MVLISRNQAWNVSRLIESVLEETLGIQRREILLVDSASTDRTIAIARRYLIRILRLRPDQRLTSHAGRYVGYKHTSGELVLFLDGDMELCRGWLEKAMAFMQTRPDVGAIAGPWIDLPTTTPLDYRGHLAQRGSGERDVEVTTIGGAAMYRRSVLEQVGPFNPYLYSDGEPELCVRIRHAGYRIIKLAHLVAYHYSDPSDAISTLMGRRKRNLWLGIGQSMRYHFGTELFWPYVKERGHGCLPALGLTAGLVSTVASVVTRQWIWFGTWLLLMLITIAGGILLKRSLYRTAFSLVQRLFVLDGTVRGFLMKPMAPESYPCKLDVIQ